MNVLSERQRAIEPKRFPAELDWSDFDEMSAKAARRTCPYQEGDVVPFWDGFDLREGLIVGMSMKYMPRREEWCPLFSVRVRRKDGKFGYLRRLVWPGMITRGFEHRHEQQESPVVSKDIDPMMNTWAQWQSSPHGKLAMDVIAALVVKLGGQAEFRCSDLWGNHLEFHHDARDDKMKFFARPK